MDSILFYGDRDEATRRQVRSAAASHSHRIGPRKAKASKKPKAEEHTQSGRRRKLESCSVTTSTFAIDKTVRNATASPPKVHKATDHKISRHEILPGRQEPSPASTASSLDSEAHGGRLAPVMLDFTQQSTIRGQPLSIKSDHSSPSLITPSPSMDQLPPRSNPDQRHFRHDSAADPLVITRIPTRLDAPRYERSFDGRLHLVASSTNSLPQKHISPPALRVLPDPSSFARPTSRSSDVLSGQGMGAPRSSSEDVVEDDRLRMSFAG
ncbi:hypothetical protein CLAFUW4_12618 [Fulvia fulva]|uniref:Uncharacterized protein n=1 Tax=Passalora fulva TaxID=5499 RepID=A0A9Q8PFA6_PASFU|nr:uncharacterized protein CLAFUR5_11642 [Fulvia fulva]KAK4617506.1 hypothetical protein CLAFUR4_12623 [Fulvia fulva]KAK4618572.1 hypothetical protein CLAFUR0_12634 [Fulvia fulva]UJO21347.1 hypothetical protein CLAFUR5_11642 [Fulvia fulva]WPV17810.1 hypothetical protein CLAFUW4_12618 [Fulvia fulva]WPV33406.1 hypothetical protein CLAFUW7_12625 [Fulvia fulva]